MVPREPKRSRSQLWNEGFFIYLDSSQERGLMTSFEVRPATVQDIEGIIKVWQKMVTQYKNFDARFISDEATPETCQTWLNRPDACLMIADRQGECIGYILGLIYEIPMLVPQHCGLIGEIGVDGYAHQSGIGSALFQGIQRWFKEQNVTTIEVRVPHRHPVAQAFWRGQGATDYVDQLWKRIAQQE